MTATADQQETPSLLLKNGTVLQHDEENDDVVHVLRNTDIFIVGPRIERIGQNLEPRPSTRILDCTDKIVSPGFINAHHHVWQTQLKGRHGDHTFLDYIPAGNLQSYNYDPSDAFWGQLAGNLELIDGGTTTVVDHAHITVSPEHTRAALNGTLVSGIRSIFCYGPMPFRVAKWTSETFELDRTDPLPDWFWTQLEELSQEAPFGPEGLVQLGFFFDSYFLPPETIRNLFTKVRGYGAGAAVKLITSHFRHFPLRTGQDQIPEILDSLGLLGPDILLSHGNGVSKDQASLLRKSKVYIASTPDAEISMASGGYHPTAFHDDLQPFTCLGADCHSVGPGNMLHQMQTALAHDRAHQTDAAFARSKYPRALRATVRAAFNLATIRGARAIGMKEHLGTLTEGKLADILVFDTSTPTMMMDCFDPITAIVRHATVRDIETVIVNGVIRKDRGGLVDVDVDVDVDTNTSLSLSHVVVIGDRTPTTTRSLSWTDVARNLASSRSRIDARGRRQNHEIVKDGFVRMMGGGDVFV